MFPAHTAERTIPVAGARVSVDLYLIAPYMLAEYERYLNVTTSSGTVSKKMFSDWGGASRTSLYLTPDRRLMVLGPADNDYSISLSPLQIGSILRQSSDDWIYLGAFDFYRDASSGRGVRVFRFLTAAEQAECIPSMGGVSPGPHRSSAYRSRCPG